MRTTKKNRTQALQVLYNSDKIKPGEVAAGVRLCRFFGERTVPAGHPSLRLTAIAVMAILRSEKLTESWQKRKAKTGGDTLEVRF